MGTVPEIDDPATDAPEMDDEPASDDPAVLRFRHHRGRAVAGFIVGISMLTLVAVWPWAALLLLGPATFVAWVLRAGTDADRTGLTVRALLKHRRIGWPEVDAIHPDHDGQAVARLRRGTQLTLPAVTASDIPLLTALVDSHHRQ